jgi:hypothetical protein
MPPDPLGPLQTAAVRKHEAALQRAAGALRDLDAAGEKINFQTVARAAGVSRQWLYKQQQLRAEIDSATPRRPAPRGSRPRNAQATRPCANATAACSKRTHGCAPRTRA